MISNTCQVCLFQYNDNTHVKINANCGFNACSKCMDSLEKESKQLNLQSCQICKCLPEGHSYNYINDNIGGKLHNICREHSLTNYYICSEDSCYYQIGCIKCFENHSEHKWYDINNPNDRDQLNGILIKQREGFNIKDFGIDGVEIEGFETDEMEIKSNDEKMKLENNRKCINEEIEAKLKKLYQVLIETKLNESFDMLNKTTVMKFEDSKKVQTQFIQDIACFKGLSDQNIKDHLRESLNLLNSLFSYKYYQNTQKYLNNLEKNSRLIKNHFNSDVLEFINIIFSKYLFTSYKCNCTNHSNCQCYEKYINSDGYKRVLENKTNSFENDFRNFIGRFGSLEESLKLAKNQDKLIQDSNCKEIAKIMDEFEEIQLTLSRCNNNNDIGSKSPNDQSSPQVYNTTVNNNSLTNVYKINSTINNNNNNQQTNNENQNNNHNTHNAYLQQNYSPEINESYMDDLPSTTQTNKKQQ